jgi:hypothetical protein
MDITIIRKSWTAADSATATAEGWDLFDYDGTGLRQIQRDDGADLFESDDAAISHVISRAGVSDLHYRGMGHARERRGRDRGAQSRARVMSKPRQCETCDFWVQGDIGPKNIGNVGQCRVLMTHTGGFYHTNPGTPFWAQNLSAQTTSWQGEKCNTWSKRKPTSAA